jgi:hypothetical protein
MAQKIQTLFIDDIDGGEADGTVARRATAARSGRRAISVDTAAVRTWARENGYDVKDRGRVPADLVAKYEEAVR